MFKNKWYLYFKLQLILLLLQTLSKNNHVSSVKHINSEIELERDNNKKESKKKVKELPDPSFDNNNAKPKILFY